MGCSLIHMLGMVLVAESSSEECRRSGVYAEHVFWSDKYSRYHIVAAALEALVARES